MAPKSFALLVALAVSNVAFAQTDSGEMPKSMLGFLTPGMRLSVTSVEGTTSVSLRTYTGDDYAVAQALSEQVGSSLKRAASLAETNDAVRKELDDYAARLALSDQSKDRIMIAPLIRTSFGKVVAVGDDYVLVLLDGEQKRQRIIPKASIGTIYLAAKPIRLIDLSARSRMARGK